MNSLIKKSEPPSPAQSQPLIWLCASGLSLALMLFLGVFIMILWQGLNVFAPKPVIEVDLVAPLTTNGPQTIAGIKVKTFSNVRTGREEWQILTGPGNNDNSMFAYVPASEVKAYRYPSGLAIADGLDSGPLFFYPLALELPDRQVEATDPEFKSLLRLTIHQNYSQYKRIQHLKRESLRIYGEELNDLKNRKIPSNVYNERIQELENAIARVQSNIEAVERERQLPKLTLRLPDGSQLDRSVSGLVSIEFTNTFGFFAKAWFFLKRVTGFLSDYPRQANTGGGIFPAIFSTFVMTLLMSMLVMPFGVIAAVYLREYARQGPLVHSIRIGVNNLAGVPSIVYGVFGLGFFVYFIGGSIDTIFFSHKLPNATFGTGGILWASLTLALMTVPVVIVATEEALAAVPKGVREASLACGASQLQTLLRVVLPASGPGIMTGLILAIARGAGEVAPLMLVGVVKMATELPLDNQFPFLHLERKFMHLGFHIYDLAFQSPNAEASEPLVFATALLLILLVICLNFSAILIRRRLRARFQSSTF